MIRSIAFAAAFGLAGLGIAAPAQAQTSLSFASWQFEEPGNSDWWRAVISAFETENPDIEIEEVYIPYADYLTQMTIRFASNRPPAVLQISEQLFGAYAEQGWLAGLDEHIAGTDIETEWAAAQDDIVWDGETRGVLVSNSALMLFYNSQILEDAGIAVPTSFEEFVDAVAAATDRDAGIFGLAAVTTEHPTAVEDFHRYTRWGGADVIVDGQYNLTSPEVAAAIETYRATVGGNAPLGNVSAVARQLFVDGRTAFLIDGPWVWSWLEGASEAMRPNLHMIEAPFGEQLAPGGISIHLSEGLDPEVEEAGFRFIEFATRPEWQREYLLMTGQPAGRASSVLTEEDNAASPHLAVISEAAAQGAPLFSSEQAVRANFNEYSSIFMQAALRTISTNDPIETILSDAQAELERAVPLD